MTSIALLLIQSLTHSLFLQTLTTLDLSDNRMGPEGAQHLGNALLENKVR